MVAEGECGTRQRRRRATLPPSSHLEGKSPRDARSCVALPSVGLRTPGTSAGWSSPYLVLSPTHVVRPSCLVLPTGLQSPLIQTLEAASAEGRDHISPTSSQTGPTSPNCRWCQHSTRCSSQA